MLTVRSSARLTVQREIFTKMLLNSQWSVFLGKCGEARLVPPFTIAIASPAPNIACGRFNLALVGRADDQPQWIGWVSETLF